MRQRGGLVGVGRKAKSGGVVAVLGASGVLHQEEEVTVW